MEVAYTIRWYRNFLGNPEMVYDGKMDTDWIYFKFVLATAGMIAWDFDEIRRLQEEED